MGIWISGIMQLFTLKVTCSEFSGSITGEQPLAYLFKEGPCWLISNVSKQYYVNMHRLGTSKHLVIQNKGVIMNSIFSRTSWWPRELLSCYIVDLVLYYMIRTNFIGQSQYLCQFLLDNVGSLLILNVVFYFWQLWRFIPIYYWQLWSRHVDFINILHAHNNMSNLQISNITAKPYKN